MEYGIRGARVLRLRVRDRLRRPVDAGYVARALREERRAVTLAARDVEHAGALDPALREVITMPVLDPDLTLHAGDEAFAGEGQRLGHLSRLQRRSARRPGCGSAAVSPGT